MLMDMVQQGVYRTYTEAIVDGIRKLYEDHTIRVDDVSMRLRLTRGDYNNLTRLSQLEGGTEELWAERIVHRYALEYAKIIAGVGAEWDGIFDRKRELEWKTEGAREFIKR
jgi:hypothetical protein